MVDYDSDDDSQAGDASLPVQFDGELARELQEQETEQVISKEQQLLADQQAAEQLQEQLRQQDLATARVEKATKPYTAAVKEHHKLLKQHANAAAEEAAAPFVHPEEEQLDYGYEDDMDIDGQPEQAIPEQAATLVASPAAQQAAPSAADQAVPTKNSSPELETDTIGKSSEQLTASDKKNIRKSMEAAVYMTFDDWSKNQDSTPLIWIEQLGQHLVDLDVNPDHVVGFLRDIHLRTRTAGTMATWIAENRRAPWSTFKGAFLRLNPGKPPKITRLTWKALSMSKQGSYHAYLSEFNRQKALISTGPDEVIETFMLGLCPYSSAKLLLVPKCHVQAHTRSSGRDRTLTCSTSNSCSPSSKIVTGGG